MAPLALPWAIPAGMKVAWGTTALMYGTGLAAVGQIQAGRAAAVEAKSAQAMANYNAAVQEREAKAIEQRTGLEQRRQAEEAARGMSRLRAGLGAAGAVTAVGAPLMVQAKQASEFELENLMIGYRGQTEAARARSAAEAERMQAKIYGRKAKTVERAGYLRAGTTLLTGFGAMRQ